MLPGNHEKEKKGHMNWADTNEFKNFKPGVAKCGAKR